MKVVFLCFLVTLCCCHYTQAQTGNDAIPSDASLSIRKLQSFAQQLGAIKDTTGFKATLDKQQTLFVPLDSLTTHRLLDDIAIAAKQIENKWLYIKTQQFIADVCFTKDWILKGIDILTQARQKASEWNLPVLEGRVHLQLGTVFDREHQNDEALMSFLKAYDIFVSLKDTANAGDALYYVALKHYQDDDYAKAVAEFRRAIEWGKTSMHYRQVINSWNALGLTFRNANQLDSARFYFDKALDFAIEKRDSAWIGIMNGNIGTLYYIKGDYKNTERNYLIDAQMSFKYKVWTSFANVLSGLGDVYTKQGKYTKAKQFYDSTLIVANAHKRYAPKARAYLGLSELMKTTNQLNKANTYLWRYIEVKDSLRKQQTQNKLLKLKLSYEFREQRNKIALLTNQNKAKEATIARQYTLNLFIGFALLMLAILSIVLYRIVHIKRKTNQQLQVKQDEILTKNDVLQQQSSKIVHQRDAIKQKNEILEERKRQVESSIRAAFAIQNALLPHHHKLKKLLKHYFLVYRPRDVVSGDFYWVNQIQHRLYVAAIDCTGHGVPGAFMSLIANTLLDKILRDANKVMPSEVLLQLHHEVRQALRPHETGSDYGMDLGLLMIDLSDTQQYNLVFAGAKRPLYYINPQVPDVQIVESTKDRFSIGANYHRKVHFHNQHICLPKGSLLYLSSDGIADQNNQHRRNFSSTKLKALLLQHHTLALHQQKELLEQTLDKYMEGTEQRDDMLLIGIRLE
jgi:serine phosphatase RsbU (regulator of sigma subunit)